MDRSKPKIILVDDTLANLAQGRAILRDYYAVYPALSAAKLFELLAKITPDLILLDIEMPDVNGYDTIKRLKADHRYRGIPVIFLTVRSDDGSELKGFELGAADYVTKPFSLSLLVKRIDHQLLIVSQHRELAASREAIKDYADNLEVKVKEKTAELFNLQSAVLSTFADLVEFRDKFTGGHVTRTKLYLKALIDELFRRGLHKEEVSRWNMDFLLQSAQLHDLGKITITDLVLNKPGKLTDGEFEVMKGHVDAGVEAIRRLIAYTEEHTFVQHALLIAGHHHEKWDGSGYPNGLSGEDISLEGRLMAIADMYDALISVRSYKDAFTHAEACEIIREGAGTHFDPELVEIFDAVAGEFDRIAHTVGI